MSFRSRKFSEFSAEEYRKATEKERSKSDALCELNQFPPRADVFGRKSYDGYILGSQKKVSTRKLSLNVPRPQDLRLPSIVSNLLNRRISLCVTKPGDITFPSVYDSSTADKRVLFKTRSTNNFQPTGGKKVAAPTNRKGLKRMRRIISVGNFFKMPIENHILPRLRFRRAVNTVLILLRVVRTNEQTSRNEVLSWAHDDITSTRRIYGLHGLSFDPSDYACRKEERLSNEAIAILSMNPEERTEEQAKLALLSLNQAVKAFEEFPKAMQKSLVRVGWYAKFEDKRVIIRQGHVADNFYLILSGKAIVTVMETDDDTEEEVVRTKALLKKGNSFGELAIMHGSRRTATVTCKNEVELLAVCREDFVDIFMPHTDNREPEHIQFLRTVNLLSGWPINKLPYHDPKICCFTYFRRGLLLCRNSNTSDWIYIIKTGSCRVLKELRYANPSSKLHNESIIKELSMSKKKMSLYQKNTSVSSIQHRTTYKKKRPKCSSENIVRILRGPLDIDYASVDEHQRFLDAVYEFKTSILNHDSKHRKHADRHSHDDNASHSGGEKPKRVFVHIQQLGPKDTYGLEQIAFGRLSTTTSTTLVSDGAECILISKKYFMQHLSDEEAKKLSNMLQPLPSENHLQQQLQDTTNWQAYKALTINNQMSNRKLVPTLS